MKIYTPRVLSSVTCLVLFLLSGRAVAHFPHDVVRTFAVSPSFDQDGIILAAIELTEHRLLARSTDGGRSWAQIGHIAAELQIHQFTFSPDWTSDGTVFAATRKGGIFKSVNRGVDWVAVNDGLAGDDVRAITFSSGDAENRVVFAATMKGLFRSTDAGESWSAIRIRGMPGRCMVVAATPGTGDIFAGGRRLFRSRDHGETWRPVKEFAGAIRSLAISPSYAVDSTLAVAFELAQEGVLVSTDGGETWDEMNDGLLPPAFVNDLSIAEDGTLFCVTSNAACYRADEVLESWTRFDDGFERLARQTDNHYFTVATSPAFADDGRVFVAGHEGFFYSVDRGETWDQSDLYHQRINRLLAFSPAFSEDGLVFVGNYGGGPMIWNERDNEWSARAGLIDSLYCGVLTPSPAFATDRTIYYGYGGTWRSTDGTSTWKKLTPRGAITRSIVMSPEFGDDGFIMINRAKAGTYRSTDGGDSWTAAEGVPKARVNDLAISPAYPKDDVVYATPVGDGIWVSTDSGASFRPIDGVLRGKNVRTFAVSPAFATDDVILAGTVEHGLFRSSDRGASFAPVVTPSGARNALESIEFSPGFADDQTVFAVSLFDGVLVSTDGGEHFSTRNRGLPIDAKRVVRVSPDFVDDQTVYVTTHAWTYRSTDAGETWQRLPGFLRVDDRHPTVKHTGTWQESKVIVGFAGSSTASGTPGATERYEFFGHSITWHACANDRGGQAEVSIDGHVEERIDLYSKEPTSGHPVFTKTYDEPAWHVVEVRVTGKKSRKSRGFFVYSDGYEYRF